MKIGEFLSYALVNHNEIFISAGGQVIVILITCRNFRMSFASVVVSKMITVKTAFPVGLDW